MDTFVPIVETKDTQLTLISQQPIALKRLEQIATDVRRHRPSPSTRQLNPAAIAMLTTAG